MAQTYEGGLEIHPGAGIPEKVTIGEGSRQGRTPRTTRRVGWGSYRDGWWAHSAASIGDWPWAFATRDAAERAVAAMLAEYPAEEWTPPVSGGVGAGPAG